jgi:hypothetical protein
MLDAFMEGKGFCYTERSEFLVAGDNTALAWWRWNHGAFVGQAFV